MFQNGQCTKLPLLLLLATSQYFPGSTTTKSVTCNAFQTPATSTATGTSIHAATRSILFRNSLQLQQQRGQNGRGRGQKLHPVFSILDRLRRIKSGNQYETSSSYSSSSTSLNMVFTTPSAIIEEASTMKLLDDLIDESVRTTPRKTVMMQFNPSSGWIWKQWKGTVFSETWRTCIINMLFALFITFVYNINKQVFTKNLAGFNVLWGQLLSVTTFTLTFFLNQSYALWRNCYSYSRRLQGRLNDLNMTMAAHAKRVEPKQKNDNSGVATNPINGSIVQENQRFSSYTEPAREVLELMARYTRVFNLLTYASFTGSHRPLLTPQGMRRMVDRGIITEAERSILSDVQLPVTQRHNALLLWIMRLFEDARQAGHLEGSSGFEQQFLEKCHVIRAQYGAIGDELQGRMPLAYAHIVQVLVDVILWMYPFMAISTGMTSILAVVGTGLLTMFYQGLFNLAKQFLDPYDNESYGKGEDPLCIDTLIGESNAGSVRWMNGLAEVPYSRDNVGKGDLLKYQLPMRGWTIEQTAEREEVARIAQLLKEEEESEKKLAEEIGLVQPAPIEIIEIDEDVEELMRGDSVSEECDLEDVDLEDLTMEEALEKIEECTEKVP